MKIVSLHTAVLSVAMALLGCSRSAPLAAGDYTLFAYPAGLPGAAIVTPGFPNADMCLFAGREAVSAYTAIRSPALEGEGEPTFECGQGCFVEGRDALISSCATTVD